MSDPLDWITSPVFGSVNVLIKFVELVHGTCTRYRWKVGDCCWELHQYNPEGPRRGTIRERGWSGARVEWEDGSITFEDYMSLFTTRGKSLNRGLINLNSAYYDEMFSPSQRRSWIELTRRLIEEGEEPELLGVSDDQSLDVVE